VGRVLPGANFAPDAGGEETADTNGHGTHVSSLACGATLGVFVTRAEQPARTHPTPPSAPFHPKTLPLRKQGHRRQSRSRAHLRCKQPGPPLPGSHGY
jgi:hypothetical protein